MLRVRQGKMALFMQKFVQRGRKLPTPAGRVRAGQLEGLLSPRSCALQADCCSAGLLAKCACGFCHSRHLCVFM